MQRGYSCVRACKRFSEIETKRSIMFLAVTLEESGLLGSEYFAKYPPIDLSNIVAGFNYDAILPTGLTNDMVVVGYGASELEDLLEEELSKSEDILTLIQIQIRDIFIDRII